MYDPCDRDGVLRDRLITSPMDVDQLYIKSYYLQVTLHVKPLHACAILEVVLERDPGSGSFQFSYPRMASLLPRVD